MPQPRVVLAGAAYQTIATGSKTVGTSSVVLAGDNPASEGVLITTDNTNTGIVYVGNSGVTANTDNNNDGIPLGPGAGLVIKIDNTNKVYAISDTIAQKVFWMVENIQA